MKLQIFQRDKKKKNVLLLEIGIVVLFLAAVLIYRTYSIYQEKQEYNLIGGSVPNQDYDLKFAFLLEDENENKMAIQKIPEGRNYSVVISCNNGATGIWDYKRWGPFVENLTETRTKCIITFSPLRPLKEYNIDEIVMESGNGLYRVDHDDATITYTKNIEEQNVLKQTEYRYAGLNPNNYVLFNNELWRIIGLVNTPEGQRLKIVRDESIGAYSWDSSASNINVGSGVNEWSQADLKILLNEGAYYNRGNDTCYHDYNDAVVPCDFRESGLIKDAKELIDMVSWNVGTNGENTYSTIPVNHFYNYERSDMMGDYCTSLDEFDIRFCNDNTPRTVLWTGQIGLMYPSDYGYATTGGSGMDRNTCFNVPFYEWGQAENDCQKNDWIYQRDSVQRLLSPGATTHATDTFVISNEGWVTGSNAYRAFAIRPTVYLKNNVRVLRGEGTKEEPYQLSL